MDAWLLFVKGSHSLAGNSGLDDVCHSRVLLLEHEPLEFLLDEPDFPGLVGPAEVPQLLSPFT
ncbi:MAG: hypothetical protein C4293_06570 [Nitrospiraceae bacterium]